jgi:hypothetical protein
MAGPSPAMTEMTVQDEALARLFARLRRLGAQDHAEQIARVIRVGQQVKLVIGTARTRRLGQPAQGREILDGETNGIEQGNLVAAPPAG